MVGDGACTLPARYGHDKHTLHWLGMQACSQTYQQTHTKTLTVAVYVVVTGGVSES